MRIKETTIRMIVGKVERNESSFRTLMYEVTTSIIEQT